MFFFLTRLACIWANLHDFLTGYQPYYHLKRLLYIWGMNVPGGDALGEASDVYIRSFLVYSMEHVPHRSSVGSNACGQNTRWLYGHQRVLDEAGTKPEPERLWF